MSKTQMDVTTSDVIVLNVIAGPSGKLDSRKEGGNLLFKV
jgi:hypothetical protein